MVGVQTLADAELEIKKGSKARAQASVTIPENQAGIQAEATLSTTDERERGAKFTADDEQIYAVQYRKISFDTFHPKDIDRAHLSTKQVWVSALKTRDNEDDQPPMIKVSLADEEWGEDFQLVSEDEAHLVLASTTTIESLNAD